MLEDGVVEYEFYYRPQEIHVHPALDRLAFLLDPDGVRIHWVTDSPYERSGLMPDNSGVEPSRRRGPARLPLVEDAWNRLRLTSKEDTVTLQLNEQLIYERELEITNQRTFGLFHYADRTAARVRNVRWRGDWPRELPAVERQELVDPSALKVDQWASELKAVMRHDFADQGLPDDKFTVVPNANRRLLRTVPEGLRVERAGGEGYHATVLAPNVLIDGDFDIVAEFEQFDARPTADSISSVGIRVFMSETDPQQALVMRRYVRIPGQEDRHLAQAVIRNGTAANNLDWQTLHSEAEESDFGRLRIVRRGDRVAYLMAGGHSSQFRLLGEAEAAVGPLPRNAISLLVQTSGVGQTNVVWKNVVIRAERMTYLPPASAPKHKTLAVMKHDGTGLRRLLPKGGVADAPGSPAWSPDAKQIAFDVYHGSTTTARMYLVDADGSNLRDIGIGNMPTFSPDGKQIAFSWGGRGVALMNADGSNRQVLDPGGWGAQWSPDGNSIAYSKGANVVVLDLKTRRARSILQGNTAARYSQIYWNLGWSRDSKHVCFKGRTRENGQYEVAVADASGSSQGFEVLYSSPQAMTADFSWHPDGHRILFPMRVGGAPRLFVLDRREPGEARLYPDQPLDHYMSGVDWSPDGKQIVFSSEVLAGWDSE